MVENQDIYEVVCRDRDTKQYVSSKIETTEDGDYIKINAVDIHSEFWTADKTNAVILFCIDEVCWIRI